MPGLGADGPVIDLPGRFYTKSLPETLFSFIAKYGHYILDSEDFITFATSLLYPFHPFVFLTLRVFQQGKHSRMMWIKWCSIRCNRMLMGVHHRSRKPSTLL